MFQDPLPYSAEYAKTGSAHCRQCEQLIGTDSLRLGIKAQSYSVEEPHSHWFHYDCFFTRARPNGPEQIDSFEYLRFEDQRRILKSIDQHKASKRSLEQMESQMMEVKATESNDQMLQQQSKLLFDNIAKLKKISRKKMDSNVWLSKLRNTFADLPQQIYHIADVVTFGKPENCRCGGVLHFKLGRYFCVQSKCPFNIEHPRRMFSMDVVQNYSGLVRCQQVKRMCDPVLSKCYTARCNQVLAWLNQNESNTVPKEVLKLNEPCPFAELENVHILVEDGVLYSAVLTKVNILENKNSYFHIQILEDDFVGDKWYVFRSNGRIGTSIRSRQLDTFVHKQDAIKHFESIYHKQTLNKWSERQLASKKPNAFCHMDLHLNNNATVQYDSQQRLYIPLGMPSKAQLLKARTTLDDISQIEQVTSDNVEIFSYIWNKFYTLFPQSFGTGRPALITDPVVIGQKIKMIDYLINIV